MVEYGNGTFGGFLLLITQEELELGTIEDVSIGSDDGLVTNKQRYGCLALGKPGAVFVGLTIVGWLWPFTNKKITTPE